MGRGSRVVVDPMRPFNWVKTLVFIVGPAAEKCCRVLRLICL